MVIFQSEICCRDRLYDYHKLCRNLLITVLRSLTDCKMTAKNVTLPGNAADEAASEFSEKSPRKGNVLLREVKEGDLPIFFEHQKDPDANYIAAFTAKDPTDESAFAKHWNRILTDEGIVTRTILFDGQVAGHVVSFEQFGEREVSYWIGKRHWGKGIATHALAMFLKEMKIRPLYARAAKDNLASIRVLKKCGFAVIGEDKCFANARGEEVEEFILRLNAAEEG